MEILILSGYTKWEISKKEKKKERKNKAPLEKCPKKKIERQHQHPRIGIETLGNIDIEKKKAHTQARTQLGLSSHLLQHANKRQVVCV